MPHDAFHSRRRPGSCRAVARACGCADAAATAPRGSNRRREERRGADARRGDPARRRLPAEWGGQAARAAAAHPVFQESRRAAQPVPPSRRGRLRRRRAGHPRPLHVRRRGRAARRGRRRLRHGRVGRTAALRGRPRRHVRRQLQRHHAAAGRADASAAPRRALSVGVVRQPLRHGVPGRSLLSRRRPQLEPRPGQGRAPPGARTARRSR